MPAYRFCRPDDIPLLAQALNVCLPLPPDGLWDVPRFKHHMRTDNLWPSSCMIALGDDGVHPIGVAMGCKRPHGTLIYSLAVHPEHRRRGHASHLLSSLSAKLAVLGPPHLFVELAGGRSDLLEYFARFGYQPVERCRSFLLKAGRAEAPLNPCVGPISLAEAEAAGLFPEGPAEKPLSWARQLTSLRNTEALEGIGFASPAALEAALFFERKGRLIIRRFCCRDLSLKDALFRILLEHLPMPEAEAVNASVSEREISWSALEKAGFTSEGDVQILCAEARPN